MPSSVIDDAIVAVQEVRSNLRSADRFGFGFVSKPCRFAFSVGHDLVEFGLKHQQGQAVVGVLASIGSRLGRNAGRDMCPPDARLGFILMLTTRAAASKRGPFKIASPQNNSFHRIVFYQETANHLPTGQALAAKDRFSLRSTPRALAASVWPQ